MTKSDKLINCAIPIETHWTISAESGPSIQSIGILGKY